MGDWNATLYDSKHDFVSLGMRAVFRHFDKVMTLIRHHLLSAGQFRLPFGERGYYDYFDKSRFVELIVIEVEVA